MQHRVVAYKTTDVSEVLTASIIRAMMASVNFYDTTWRNIPEDSHYQKSPNFAQCVVYIVCSMNVS
jgi:hypothetical protein